MNLRFMLAAFGALAFAQAAPAATIVGSDALKEWNLVVLGNLSGNTHVHGRSFVGGSITSTNAADFNMDSTVSSKGQAGLTVVGNVAGSDKKVWKNATVGGNSTAALVMNGTPQTVKVGGTMPLQNVNQNTVITNLTATDPTFMPALNSQKSDLVTSMIALSDQLKALAPTLSTAGVTIASNTATFAATGTGLNVINLAGSSLASFNQISFTNSGTTVVNVSGTSILLDDNFLGASQSLGENVLWNFYEAQTLTLNNAFYGSILAPRASATLGQDVYGSAVFASAVINGEIHANNFTGNLVPSTPVPEPAGWAMMIAGFGLIGTALRRGRRPLAAVSTI